MAQGFPITHDQFVAHLSDHGFVTNSTIEGHLEQADYLTSAGMRQWVMGALREEHNALEKRLVDNVNKINAKSYRIQCSSVMERIQCIKHCHI